MKTKNSNLEKIEEVSNNKNKFLQQSILKIRIQIIVQIILIWSRRGKKEEEEEQDNKEEIKEEKKKNNPKLDMFQMIMKLISLDQDE